MKTRSTTCSRCSRRAGLTLIEVVAAIVILGTILVGVVLARSRHTRQIRLAERKALAVRQADALLTGWWTDPNGVPVGDSGTCGQDGALVWETRLVHNPRAEDIGARTVQLTVRNAELTPAYSSDQPLVTVEIVLPVPPPDDDDKVENDRPDESSETAQKQRPGSEVTR
jgi:prepilin-type N-terminal cleavage/methylation domain-containing protein